MRLWHESLLPYLPRQQLLGQHRECCALRGKGWGKNNRIVNYVFTHSREMLWEYHQRVIYEMERRGYNPDRKWKSAQYRGTSLEPFNADEIDLDEVDKAQRSKIVYPEHNDEYLEECLKNLESKGIKLREEMRKDGYSI